MPTAHRLTARARRSPALLLALGVVASACRDGDVDVDGSGGGAGGGGGMVVDAALDGSAAPTDAGSLDGAIAPDGGYGANVVVVTLHASSLGPLVQSAALEVGRIEAHNDRGDALAAVLPVTVPIDLLATEQRLIEGAIPATYGELHLADIGALTLVVGGFPLTIALGGSAVIELRCPDGGVYLPFGGSIAMDVDVDFAPVLASLIDAGLFPPLGDTTTDDADIVAALVEALGASGVIACSALP